MIGEQFKLFWHLFSKLLYRWVIKKYFGKNKFFVNLNYIKLPLNIVHCQKISMQYVYKDGAFQLELLGADNNKNCII